MASTRIRRRVGMAVVAGGLVAGATLGMAGPASATDPPPIDPRLGCGVTRTDNGPISGVVHSLEPLFGLPLAVTVHEINCGVVTNLEVSLGLLPPFVPG